MTGKFRARICGGGRLSAEDEESVNIFTNGGCLLGGGRSRLVVLVAELDVSPGVGSRGRFGGLRIVRRGLSDGLDAGSPNGG